MHPNTASHSEKKSVPRVGRSGKKGGALEKRISYDHNGNILTLQRKQRKYDDLTASYTNETIDNLTYAYKSADKNSLEKVTDAASTSAAAGFDNGSSSTSNDYTYDTNGNLLSDANKGISSIVYNFLGKPTQVNFTDGRKIEYVYDATGNKLTQKLYQGTTLQTTTHYVNGFVYEAVTTGSPVLSFFGSSEGRVVNNSGTLQYEYSIADHQGNTRVVFTSAAPAANTTTVNFESATNSDVLNYTRTNFELFDHTDFSGSTYTYSQKLTGASGSQVGVAKSMKVYPGDKVKIEAYAKYYNPTSTSSNITGFALALTGAFGVTSSSTGEALKAYNTLNNYGGIIAAGGSGGSSEHPKLFVNVLLFDKDYNFLDAAWEQIDGGEQVGATSKAAHDLMSKEVTVKEAGYAYVFISNENPTLVEFYVDDVTITHTPTNVIQYNEYYPFGLQTSTSWTRENTIDNNYLYNAANELNKTTGWYEMYYRGYDPAIGRMLQVDPYAPLYASYTTYNYAANNPVMMNDPYGGQVSVNGYTDGQLRAMYRNDFYNHGYSGSYGDWASDNLDFGGSGGRTVIGTDGREYGANRNGQIGYWKNESSIEENSAGTGGYEWVLKTIFVEVGNNGNDPYGWDNFFKDAKTGATVVRGLTSARRIMENEYIAQATINNAIRGSTAAVPNSLRTISTVSKVAGVTGIIASWGIAGYQVSQGTDNTSTWVNAGVNTAIITAAILGGPITVGIAAGVGIVYGVSYLIYGDQMDAAINNNFGYR